MLCYLYCIILYLMTVGLSQLRVMLSKCAAPVGFLPPRPSCFFFFLNKLIHYIQINHTKLGLTIQLYPKDFQGPNSREPHTQFDTGIDFDSCLKLYILVLESKGSKKHFETWIKVNYCHDSFNKHHH